MEAGHDFGGVTLVPAPPFEELLARLDETKVLRSNRRVRSGTGQYRRRGGRRNARGDGIRDARGLSTSSRMWQCRRPRSTANLRRGADDRLAEVLNADIDYVVIADHNG